MDEFRFDNKVAIVTGAGGGLGKAYASLLASRGAKVLVNDLGGDFQGQGSDAGYAQAAADEIKAAGGIAEPNTDSVATTEGAEAIVKHAMDLWGQVDILVNNAGVVVGHGALSEITDDQWETDMGVAAGGTFRMCRAVWKHMWDRNYGRIVNVASGSFFGMGSGAGYPAAKGAVWGITRALYSAARANEKNVTINCIMPIAHSRMTVLMGEEVNAVMQRDFPTKSVAPVVAMLSHDKVPCNGEMFSVGGGGYARVMLALSSGYRGTNKDWQIEEAFENFDAAMSETGFTLPKDALEDPEQYISDVPWDVFREFIV